MPHTFFTKLYKHRKPVISFVVVISVFFYAFWSSFATKDFLVVPEMFWDSHKEGSIIAEEFVALAESTQENLQKIKELEESGKADLALDLIRTEIGRSEILKSKGVELLKSLSQMTHGLSGIRPDEARAIAHEAISSRITTVNSLIDYSNALDQILRLLTSKVLYGDDIRSTLEEKINEANESARSINDLNIKYNDTIRKLESF